MTKYLGGVFVIRIGNVSENMTTGEVNACINYMRKQYPEIKSGVLDIVTDGENVDLTLTPDVVKFQRIRRVTGYLTGTVERWNNAKQAELADRVKHNL